jgi:uncharacterized protein
MPKFHEVLLGKYTHRILEAKLKEYLDFFSVVGLTGPRQSGKSTMLLHYLPNYRYVNFDDFKMVNFFSEDPEKFMSIYDNKVIFDEIQKVPKLFNYIKIAVDQDRDNAGKFVLTGSSQFQFIQGVSESLAGRIGLLSLLPYQIIEMPTELQAESIYKGCYPELINKKFNLWQDWYSSYINTYLQKDVNALANVGAKREFQKLLNLLAANTAQILNMSTYATDVGVDVKTIKRWISILEASYIIFLLPPYYQNFGKRIVKNPKIYFYDTGLVAYLTGIDSHKQFVQGPMAGSLFENYVIADIYKKELHTKSNAELYYYRVHQGIEIDLIIDRKFSKEWIEIKHSSTFNMHWLKSIETLISTKDPKLDQGFLLYTGKPQPYTKQIKIMNYAAYAANV